jgi:hypothetical protein
MNTESINYTIIDDSGLLALADCSEYRPFVSPDWTYHDILQHFDMATKERTLVVWECGDGGGSYVIQVRAGISSESGYRSVHGAISVTDGALNLVSYDALTMAAQFDDEVLPSRHEKHLRFELPNGDYRIRIVQLYDPDRLSKPDESELDFIVEYEPGDSPPWSGMAWSRDSS